ncbi:MAG TPA: hypothetical protein VM492_12365 [Sumerlaeia bacterium]|nr:hypothetical protein [Sumerlaeia bacterium]
MNDETNPRAAPPPRSAEETLRRAVWLWRCCLGLPFLYLGIAALVERIWFEPNSHFGFWPMREEHFNRLILSFGFLALVSQGVLIFLRMLFEDRMEEVRLMRARVAELYWKRTLYMAACADVVSGLGLVAFLIHADWMPLVGFCICSYFLYAQAYPRARLLDDPGKGSRES